MITFWSLKSMVASVNFRYFLQIKIMWERESRRQRCLLMKHIILRRRQKQKLFITLCSALISLCRKQKVKRNRRVRRSEWNCGWFQKVWNIYDDERFKSCFRISRETFNFILNWIGHHLTHDTTAEEPTLPQERLGIRLYRLSRLQKWQGVDWQLYSALLKKFVKWLSVTFGMSLLIFLK